MVSYFTNSCNFFLLLELKYLCTSHCFLLYSQGLPQTLARSLLKRWLQFVQNQQLHMQCAASLYLPVYWQWFVILWYILSSAYLFLNFSLQIRQNCWLWCDLHYLFVNGTIFYVHCMLFEEFTKLFLTITSLYITYFLWF